jgi:hypothetical protein
VVLRSKGNRIWGFGGIGYICGGKVIIQSAFGVSLTFYNVRRRPQSGNLRLGSDFAK